MRFGLFLILVIHCTKHWLIESRQGNLLRRVRPKRNEAAEQILVRHLLRRYKKQGRPVRAANSTINVEIAFALQQITSLDERDQVMNSRGWLSVAWRDELLTWNRSEFGGVRYLALWPRDVWIPELAVGNSITHVFDKSYLDIRLIVMHNGTVYWFPGGLFHTTCTIEIFYYPFDDQRCSIVVQQWTYFQTEVDLHNSSSAVDLSEYTKNGEWNIYTTTTWKHEVSYPIGVIPEIYFDIYLQRKVTFVLVNVIFPCVLITCLDLMVFCLAPDSGEKISLGTTVLLAFTIFMLLIAESVPKTSDTVPIITIYLTSLMALTTLSVMMSVLVLRVHHSDENLSVGSIGQLFFKFLLFLARDGKKKRKVDVTGSWVAQNNISLESSYVTKVRKDSRLEVHLNEKSRRFCQKDMETSRGYRNLQLYDNNIHMNEMAELDTGNDSDDEEVQSPVWKKREDFINSTKSAKKKTYFTKSQYKRAAQMFDRLLLYLFLIINIALVLILLVFVPLTKPLPKVVYLSTFGELMGDHSGEEHTHESFNDAD